MCRSCGGAPGGAARAVAKVRRMLGYRRRLAALVAAGLLAAPATAFGQSAGDEQYEDPFAGENQEQPAGGSDEDGGGGSQPAVPEPTAPAPEPTGQEPAPAPTESGPAPTPQPQLPNTGADAGAVVLAGALLLAGGIALRVRMRDRA
jgi:LPXTG-motif cell wall-anchored protein